MLAASVLLALLCFVVAVAAWRGREDYEARRSLEHRAGASVALERATSQLYLLTALSTASVIADNPAPFIDLLEHRWAGTQETIAQARAELVSLGELEEVDALDDAAALVGEFGRSVSQITARMRVASDAERLAMAQQVEADLWPQGQAAITQFSSVADRQRARLSSEQVQVSRAGDTTLWTLVGASVVSFIVGSAALAYLTRSVLTPLASLQTSVRAVASGDLQAAPKVSGPTEIRSLAHDFNEMVAARRKAEEALKHQAATDSLTGIYNHRSLHEILAREVDRSLRHEHPVSVLMMDMDGFKLFNDTYGHQEGDRVLVQVANILKEAMRAHDIVGRYGGDEFMAILPETDRDQAIACANRVLEAVAKGRIKPRKGGDLPLAISIGLAVCPDDSDHKEELVAYADASLMEAKQIAGGNLVVAHRHSDDSIATRRTPFGVLDALVRAVDRKDRYTRSHSQQNAEFAVELGKAIGLSEGAVNALRIAGLLHDVGKIGVPDDILRKPGTLTNEEQAIMREHVTLSNLIVHGVPNLQDVSDAVYSHHERWDGTGYPRALKGGEIPLPGRIMALVDAYSAMILDRPYRKALAHAEAAEELRQNAGSQFDPDLVEPFIAMMEARSRAAA